MAVKIKHITADILVAFTLFSKVTGKLNNSKNGSITVKLFLQNLFSSRVNMHPSKRLNKGKMIIFRLNAIKNIFLLPKTIINAAIIMIELWKRVNMK